MAYTQTYVRMLFALYLNKRRMETKAETAVCVGSPVAAVDAGQQATLWQ